MPRQAGIPVVALFDTLDQINQALPGAIQNFVNRFSAVELDSHTSPGGVIHKGRIQSILESADSNTEEFDFGWAKLEIPLLTEGVPFQFSVLREPVADDLEPGAERWQFDILLDSLTLTLRDLVGADYVAESGTLPRHLVAKVGLPPVAITGSAAMRFERAGPDQPVVVKFIDVNSGPDPFVPMSLSGGVAKVAVSPPHFLIGTSNFGMTVKNLLFDYSTEYSPAFVLERGQPANWVGLAIDEITLYTPANATGQGGFSAGVRNFLIGDPAGLQATFEMQWGRSAIAASTFEFHQAGTDITSGFNVATGILNITARAGEPVQLTAGMTSVPPATASVTWEAEFDFPGTGDTTGLTGSGLVQHDDVLRITPIEIITDAGTTRRVRHNTFTVRMVASGEPPEFAVVIAGTTLSNVVNLTGTRAQLEGTTLNAVLTPPVAGASFTWVSQTLNINHSGTSLTLSLPGDATGEHDIELTRTPESDGSGAATKSRLRLRIRGAEAAGNMLIGCETGVFQSTAPTSVVVPDAVLGTYDLTSFHAAGTLAGANAQATLTAVNVDVPAGAIAEVALGEGGAAPVTAEDRHVQILYDFDESVPLGWGPETPTRHRSQDVHLGLLTWANKFTGANFLIIGRCDDVGSDSYNVGLADNRANAIRAKLTTATGNQTAIAAGQITRVTGEQSTDMTSLSVAERALVTPDSAENRARYILTAENTTRWPKKPDGSGQRDAAHEDRRKPYRRADVYAVGGTATGDTVTTTQDAIDPTRRRVLVPANDRTALQAVNRSPQSDYRVKLVLGWDRARFTGWEDVVPNLAEFEYVWTNPAEGLPPSTDPISPDREELTVYGKWIYDDLTGFTELVLGLKSDGDPDGLLATTQKNLVAALTFGPMLASGVDFDNDVFGSAVRLAALGGLVAFASSDVISTTGQTLIATGPAANPTKSALKALESRSQTANIENPFDRFKTQLTVDYTNTVHINAGAIGLQTDPNQPMKVRYSKIGIEFDNTDPTAELIEKFGFVFASDSMAIEDSGLWQISGPLARLLRITRFRMGNGSLWIEPTMSLALSLGVVEVTEASFRITFRSGANPEFTLRGLAAKVDIPGALKGAGSLKIEDGGVIKASLDITVVPLKIRAMAALAVGSPPEVAPSVFLNLYAKVQFPGGIPLGPLPLAIHGFIGQTVINGRRDVAVSDDVVSREIGWWRKAPQEKYRPERGQHALGIGVIVGTLPDASFSFSATGMVVVAFPDIEVIFGVEVNLLSVPDKTAKDKKEGNTGTITGLVVINSQAVTVAVSAQYEIPEVLKLTVPFAAYFPGSGADTYVRIGSDGVNGRSGSPITIEILPTTLNLKAWAYLMIEGGGIQRLGGHEDFNFDGFSIGFGAGIDISWKAGPIGLEASAKILVGMGTDPLLVKGGFFVSGKLDLVVVSVSVRGEIILTYLYRDGGSHLSLEGEFCGSVDLFFFSIEGCIDFSIGTQPLFTPPEPPPPAKSIALVDRNYTIMGEGTTGTIASKALFDFNTVIASDGTESTVNEGADPKDNHTVWPDSIPVINFAHYIKDNLPNSGQFDPNGQPTGEPWFGSNRLKYAYRLDSVAFVEVSGGGETNVVDPGGSELDSAWVHSPSRPADDTSTALPSGAEVTNLQLLDWNPTAWARPTEDGGASQPGDPAQIIDRICEPGPDPNPACLLGSDVMMLSPVRAKLRRPTPADGPYASGFTGFGDSFSKVGANIVTGIGLTTMLSNAGFQPVSGRVVNLPFSVNAAGKSFQRGYKLPSAERISGDAITCTTMDWRASLTRPIVSGDMFLLVCDKGGRGPGGGQDNCYSFDDIKPGTEGVEFSLKPFILRAMDERQPIKTRDAVDASRIADPRFGSDRQTDIDIPNGGASLDLRTPCHDLVLSYLRPGDGPVKFTVFHADGSVTHEQQDAPASVPMQTRLTSDSGITRVEIYPSGKSVLLYRVCCEKPGNGGGGVQRDCIRMDLLPKSVDGASSFNFEGAEFRALDPQETFVRRDDADIRELPVRAGNDGLFELRMPPDGVEIKLPAECFHLEISVMQFTSRPMKIVGLDADGKEVASTGTLGVQGIGQTVSLVSNGNPISTVTITGGGGEALLYSICCLRSEGKPDAKTCVNLHDLPRDFDGKRQVTFDGLIIEPVARREAIKLTDRLTVDGKVQEGADRKAELLIFESGLRIQLPGDCRELELHVMIFGRPVIARAFNQDGKVIAEAESTEKQGEAQIIRLNAKGPIAYVEISGGSDEAVLYRICCLGGQIKPPSSLCIKLGEAKIEDKVAAFDHRGLIFRDEQRDTALALVKGDGQMAPRDSMVLAFAETGLRIDLPRDASFVRLNLSFKADAEFKVSALNSDGKVIVAEGGKGTSTSQVINLRADAISAIRINGEAGGLLAEICQRENGIIDKRDFGISRTSDGFATLQSAVDSQNVPGVRSGRKPGDPNTGWPSQVISTHERPEGGICKVVRYQMPPGSASADLIEIINGVPDRDITLLSLCAIDEAAQIRADNDQFVREELRDAIVGAGTGSGGSAGSLPGKPIFLKPGTEYRIRINWSWQAWEASEGSDNAPAVPSGAWTPATQPQLFKFRTANELNAPGRQDGLNENIFDPRDVERYLVGSEPKNGGTGHFTDDPIVFHFSQDHLASLLDAYDREFDIVVRRTDPPAESGVAIGDLTAPLTGVIEMLPLPISMKSPLDQRLDLAIAASPCLDLTVPATPGQTMVATFELDPNAMYDADLLAADTSGSGDDIRVTASRFVTSRYANPRGMIEAFEFNTDGTTNPTAPGELIVEAGVTMPSSVGGLIISDSAFDAAMLEMGFDTLGLPEEGPRMFQIWQMNGANPMRLAGLLLDGIEPINREASVVVAGKIEKVARCRVNRIDLSGRRFRPVRETQNATRILLVPQTGSFVPSGSTALIRLDTSAGLIQARKFMRTVPLVMEIEGF